MSYNIDNSTGDRVVCNYMETYYCARPALLEYKSDVRTGASSCTSSCQPQCNSKSYVPSISQNIFSNRFADFATTFYRSINQTMSKEFLDENYVAIQIFFSSMQYLDITTDAGYSFMGLLSDVGGALGLLLGATLLTCFEIVEFFGDITIRAVVVKIKSRSRDKHVTPQPVG